MRAVYIGPGYVKNKGPVDVYSDDERTDRLHCLTKRDEWIYLNRNRVVFTKGPQSNAKEK